MQPLGLGCVLPLEAVADQIYEAAHHPPVVNSRTPCERGKQPEIPAIWPFVSKNRSHIDASFTRGSESTQRPIRNQNKGFPLYFVSKVLMPDSP
jgi:hypothetical protein